MEQAINPRSAEDLVGKTWHLLRGSKYAGTFAVVAAEPVDGGWIHITHGASGRGEWHTRTEDAFLTEEAARAEAKARRKPRTRRQPTALYGDFAFVAAINGIRTDGTGHRA